MLWASRAGGGALQITQELITGLSPPSLVSHQCLGPRMIILIIIKGNCLIWNQLDPKGVCWLQAGTP